MYTALAAAPDGDAHDARAVATTFQGGVACLDDALNAIAVVDPDA